MLNGGEEFDIIGTEKEISDLEEQVKKYQREINTFKAELTQLTLSEEDLKKEKIELKKILDQSYQKLKQEINENHTLKAKITTQNDEIKQIHSHFEIAKKDFESYLNARDNKIEEQKIENENLKKEIANQNQEIQNIRLQFVDEKKILQEDLAKNNENIQLYSTKNKRLEDQLNLLKQDLEKLKNLIIEKQNTSQHHYYNYLQALANLKDLEQKSLQQLTEAKKEWDAQYQITVAAKEQENIALQQKNESLMQELREITFALHAFTQKFENQHEFYMNKLTKMQKLVEKTKESFQVLLQTLHQKERKIDELNSNLQQKNKIIQQLMQKLQKQTLFQQSLLGELQKPSSSLRDERSYAEVVQIGIFNRRMTQVLQNKIESFTEKNNDLKCNR